MPQSTEAASPAARAVLMKSYWKKSNCSSIMFPQDPVRSPMRYHFHRAAVSFLDIIVGDLLRAVVVEPLV